MTGQCRIETGLRQGRPAACDARESSYLRLISFSCGSPCALSQVQLIVEAEMAEVNSYSSCEVREALWVCMLRRVLSWQHRLGFSRRKGHAKDLSQGWGDRAHVDRAQRPASRNVRTRDKERR